MTGEAPSRMAGGIRKKGPARRRSGNSNVAATDSSADEARKHAISDASFGGGVGSVQNQSSLFNNPAAAAALANMSESDRQFYEDMGKEIYDKINFEVVTEGADGSEVPLEEIVANIRSALKSGLRPEDLDEGELAAMRTYYEGSESWRSEFS